MDLSKDTDEQLVCKFNAQGNEYAFEELWHRHFKMTNRVVNKQRYLIMKDSKDDLMNECAIKMLTCIKKYNGSTKFITFYVHAIENMLLSKIRILNFSNNKANYDAINASDLKKPNWAEECDDNELFSFYLPPVEDDNTLFENCERLISFIKEGLEMIEPSIRKEIEDKITGKSDESDESIGKKVGMTRNLVRKQRLQVSNYVKFKIEQDEQYVGG